jgi:hypothetical protein
MHTRKVDFHLCWTEILTSHFFQAPLWKSVSPSSSDYHELNGFSSLPDILWHSETRKFIEADLALRREFKKPTSSRCAKKAYEGFVSIAAVILFYLPSDWPAGRGATRRKAK